jgi:hypothetical protein
LSLSCFSEWARYTAGRGDPHCVRVEEAVQTKRRASRPDIRASFETKGRRRVVYRAMSIKHFESTLLNLLAGGTVPDPSDQINPGAGSRADTARALNAAFLITLAGPGHPLFWEADVLFEKIIRTEEGSRLGRYFQRGRSAIWREIEQLESEELQLGEILSTEEDPPSEISVTATYLRTSIAAAVLFAEGRNEEAAELLERSLY